jgi:hypothetical protein
VRPSIEASFQIDEEPFILNATGLPISRAELTSSRQKANKTAHELLHPFEIRGGPALASEV